MRKFKIPMNTLISCFLFFSVIPSVSFPTPVLAAGSLQTTQNKDNPNIYYFVGNFSHDIWMRSNGEWTSDGSPGMRKPMNWNYSFEFPGRKIKSIDVRAFDENENLAINNIGPGLTGATQVYENSRYGETWADSYMSVSKDYTTTVGPINGKGTSSARFIVYTNGLLTAHVRHKDITEEGGSGLADGVEGRRYFFPNLLTIELEPETTQEGKAIVKHFTTSKQPLDGIEGFKDYEKKLELDEFYSFMATPGTTKYKYEYYRKSTMGDPSETAPLYGDPMSFTYKGDFPVYYLNLYYSDGGGSSGPPTGSSGCTEPSPSGQVKESPLTPPDVRAVIKADARGNEHFDVLDGIPTSESLYGNVWAKSYLSKNKFVQMSGKCTFEVTVNREYELKWDPGKKVPKPDGTGEMDAPDPQTATETLTKSYTVERPYSFWVIDNLEVYQIDQAKLWNYAFNGGGITIMPSGYSPPSFTASKSSGYTPPNSPGSVDAPKGSKSGGKEKPDISNENLESYAEQAVEKVKVKNDSLTFNGSTVMSGAQSNETGPTPSQVPLPPEIGQNVLYSPGNTIPTSKINQPSQPSTGTIYYGLMSGNINGGANVNYAIYGINPVTVHTPVVIYPEVSDDAEHNQKTRPAAGRSAIILDRPFTVEMPNSGQHANYRGYGYNNYLKYIGSKQVRFPFDVYDGSRTTFYPKDTWIEVDKTRESFTYFLPVWVDEGFYEAEFRTIAHNAPAGASHQNQANLDLAHHIAYDTVPVDVIGRVYDFRITDISDYNWEPVFRTAVGSVLPTGASYWVGLNGIDGAARGNSGRFTLPIRPGSHPLYQNAVIKTGYHFKFDLKTKGNMFGPNDRIRITPSFYFVSAKDGTRVAADLYYHAGNRSYVKIGSSRDLVQRYVILNERLRNVPMEELVDTALYKYDHDFTFDQISGISRTQYVQNYIRRISGQRTPIGSLSLLELNERIRTWIGPKSGIPSGVDPARVNASMQKWYGEYSLPADLYVVKAGTNVAEFGRTHNGLSDHSPVFLKDGYIVVNFNIETVRNGESSQPYLQYINAPLMNQWTQMEGFARTVTDPYGRSFALRDGDVVFYEANRSSRDDFSSMVTH